MKWNETKRIQHFLENYDVILSLFHSVDLKQSLCLLFNPCAWFSLLFHIFVIISQYYCWMKEIANRLRMRHTVVGSHRRRRRRQRRFEHSSRKYRSDRSFECLPLKGWQVPHFFIFIFCFVWVLFVVVVCYFHDIYIYF